jgi:hypothetical protein
MNIKKDLSLGRVVLAVAGLLIVLFVVYNFLWVPFDSYNTQIRTLETEIRDKQTEVQTIRREKPLLARWRQESLPGDQIVASSGYLEYLDNLLKPRSKVKVDSWNMIVGEQQGRQGPLGAKQKPVYTPLIATVKAHATLADLTTVLRRFQETPLVHKIKSLKIEPEKEGKLKFDLVVEALVIEGAEKEQPNLIGVNGKLVELDVLSALYRGPAWFSLLSRAGPSRNYADIARKDIFTGPLPPPVIARKKEERGQDIRSYVRLNMIQRDSFVEKAILLDRFNNNKEIVLRDTPKDNTFRIFDSLNHEVAKAEVLKIGSRDLYFRVEKGGGGIRPGIYGLEIGQSLREARHLEPGEAKKLGLVEKGGKNGEKKHKTAQKGAR